MTGEEVALNEYLEKNGIALSRPTLASTSLNRATRPLSHLIAPAIRLMKEQIVGTFASRDRHPALGASITCYPPLGGRAAYGDRVMAPDGLHRTHAVG